MQLVHRTPTAPLSSFVQTIWGFEGLAQAHRLERLLPDGSLALVINLQENRSRIYDREDTGRFETFSGCIVSGPQSRFCVIDTDGQCSTVGIHFRPGGAVPFLGLPADELCDRHVSLDGLWGSMAAELRERVLEAASPAEKLRVVEQVLLQRVRKLAFHPVVRFALSEFHAGPRQISDVTDRIGMSSRRFIQLFREQVGMTPKLFCRVRRFQDAVQAIRSGKPVEWAQVALDAGYFDQPHFIHDFREFSGMTPTAYAATDPRHANHVPLL